MKNLADRVVLELFTARCDTESGREVPITFDVRPDPRLGVHFRS